jgi:sulfur-carrier protein adenylyltransferase/sulfurtransferase
MGVLDHFKRVSEWKVQKVKDFLEDKKSEDYNLLDVRQPGEYEKSHLPGARLIPVGDLPDRLRELDPKKPTITY